MLLTAIGVGKLHLAGCLNWIPDDPPELALGRIHIENHSDQDVEVDVSVTKDSERVYQEEHLIRGEETSGEYPQFGAMNIVEDWMGELAEYEFRVEVVDSEIGTSLTTESVTESVREQVEEAARDDIQDGTCFEFTARFGEPGHGGELDDVTIGYGLLQTEDSLETAPSCNVSEE
ncbi:hypothetical protein C500_10059 [Natrialba magadii ATCC 43099]|nr:hypothetical protein C500_10059 [Natrialba magadii ATCC 43099]